MRRNSFISFAIITLNLEHLIIKTNKIHIIYTVLIKQNIKNKFIYIKYL